MDPTLVVCHGDGIVALHQRAPTGEWEQRRTAEHGLWPTPSPNGELVAVSTIRQEGYPPAGSIVLSHIDGLEATTAHLAAAGGVSVIAPRVPHYVYWSPRSDVVSFVAPSDDGLGLFLSDAAGAFSSHRIATGAPLFSCWHAAGDVIAIHSGPSLSCYRVSTRETTVVAVNAMGFRAPAFIGDTLLYAVPEAPGVALMAADAFGGGAKRVLGRFPGGVAILERPGSTEVAVAVSNEPESGVFNSLVFMESSGSSQSARVVRGPFVAAWWSPRGDRIALVVPTQIGDGRFAIHVRDAAGALQCATEPFVPSQDMRIYLGFFDQYMRSHSLWSPEGDALVLSGRLGGDGAAWSFSDRMNDYVLYWLAERNSTIEVVSEGDMAVFMPGRPG